jgi:RNA polymerase sigma-70 factor (ECF subfamily)
MNAIPSYQPNWDRFRAYLLLLARQHVEPARGNKIDLSGLVQQTLLEAHQHAAQVASLQTGQQMAWLRKALARNLADEVKRRRAAKRDVARERSLDVALENSAANLEQWLPAPGPSPSQAADRHERLLALAEAILALPPAQRAALEAHYFQGQPVADIAAAMDKSVAAVAGLLKRALQQLRSVLAEEE